MSETKTQLTRRQSRELAFQFLYGLGDPLATAHKRDFELFCQNFGNPIDVFAWELVEGTGQNFPSIDKKISALSAHWRIERMPKVDLTILRMAAYEILYREDIPKTVAINEAIELAKRFGSEDSAAFVNGILDKLEKPALE